MYMTTVKSVAFFVTCKEKKICGPELLEKMLYDPNLRVIMQRPICPQSFALSINALYETHYTAELQKTTFPTFFIGMSIYKYFSSYHILRDGKNQFYMDFHIQQSLTGDIW